MSRIVQPNQDFLASLGDLPLFQGLTRRSRETLIQCATVIACDQGEVLFREGEPAEGFFILKTGRVKIRRISNSGREVVLHLSSPPQMIGCRGLTLPGSTYHADAVAVDSVIALRVRRDLFMRQMADIPDVFFNLLVNMNQRLSEIYTLQSAILEPTEQRVATLLMNQSLPESWDRMDLDKLRPRAVRMTKSLIASIVGATTETIIRLLSKWKKKGFIDSERGIIQILDPYAVFQITRGRKSSDLKSGAGLCHQCPVAV
ncbi:MAG: Crp/Fnr family transcriptional regulator [Acidobacteriota bacterium]|nr:Crp/Fnr family transcriptional regulator [Acidobacteriota bacterium]